MRTPDTSPNDYNLPVGRRALEKNITRSKKITMPSNIQWFDTEAIGDLPDSQLSNTDKFMWYVIRKRIKPRSNIGQLVRCMYLYGRCHLKTSITISNGLMWPTQRVIDPFSFYFFPETATIPEEKELAFEDYLYSYEKYKALADKGFFEDVSQSQLSKAEWPYHLVERIGNQGITDPQADVGIIRERVEGVLNKMGSNLVSLSEIWLNRRDKLYQAYIMWNRIGGPRIVAFGQSDYDYPLFRSAIHRPLPNEGYTNSEADDIAELQDLSNDQLNQFLEAVNWEQGIVATNADDGGARKDTWKMSGRQRWDMSGDPRELLHFIAPPITSTNQLRAWQILMGLIDQHSGGTLPAGQPGRNMPRAGFAMNNLLDLSLAEPQDIAQAVEDDVLTPSLSDIHYVSNKFMPEWQLIRIPGAKGIRHGTDILSREDIRGDYLFEWVGSQQFQDNNIRAQRIMIFLDMLQVIEPMLQRQGYTFNVVELTQTFWRSVLGERSLSNIVVPIGKLREQTEDSHMDDQMERRSNRLKYTRPNVNNGFIQQT